MTPISLKCAEEGRKRREMRGNGLFLDPVPTFGVRCAKSDCNSACLRFFWQMSRSHHLTIRMDMRPCAPILPMGEIKSQVVGRFQKPYCRRKSFRFWFHTPTGKRFFFHGISTRQNFADCHRSWYYNGYWGQVQAEPIPGGRYDNYPQINDTRFQKSLSPSKAHQHSSTTPHMELRSCGVWLTQ